MATINKKGASIPTPLYREAGDPSTVYGRNLLNGAVYTSEADANGAVGAHQVFATKEAAQAALDGTTTTTTTGTTTTTDSGLPSFLQGNVDLGGYPIPKILIAGGIAAVAAYVLMSD